MRLLNIIILGGSLAFAQSTSPATPPKGTQVNDIPILGLGTWNIHERGGNVTEIIASAIQSGYRHLDCAYIYGNQKQIALGIKEGLRRTGLERKDLWITSKLWSNMHGDPEAGIKQTLTELGLDYLDLYLIHWPVASSSRQFDHVPTWKRMEQLVRPQGGTRFLGISNFSPKQVEEILAVATIKPKVHQIELHPYLQQDAFVAFLQKQGIAVTAYSPLANTNPTYGSLGSRAPKILTNPTIATIAKARNCSPAQVVLAWNMARNVAVIPKAASLAHQKENIAAVKQCVLQSDDLQKIKAVQIPLRLSSSVCVPLRNACFEGLEAA